LKKICLEKLINKHIVQLLQNNIQVVSQALECKTERNLTILLCIVRKRLELTSLLIFASMKKICYPDMRNTKI